MSLLNSSVQGFVNGLNSNQVDQLAGFRFPDPVRLDVFCEPDRLAYRITASTMNPTKRSERLFARYALSQEYAYSLRNPQEVMVVALRQVLGTLAQEVVMLMMGPATEAFGLLDTSEPQEAQPKTKRKIEIPELRPRRKISLEDV